MEGMRLRQRFPHETINRLSGTEIRLLELINYRTRKQAQRSPTGARYCIDPQAYFAKCLGVRRETISRAVTRLATAGILDVTHRRKRRGQWQTCMYRIRNWLWWRAGKILALIHRAGRAVIQGKVPGAGSRPPGTPPSANRVSNTSHLSAPKGEGNTEIPPEPRANVPAGYLTQLFEAVLAGKRLAID